MSKEWEDKKKFLARKQEEYADQKRGSTKKLKRVRINGQGKAIVDYEIWPADEPILRRIANFLEQPISTDKIFKLLEKGEKITTRFGSVYSLVPLISSH